MFQIKKRAFDLFVFFGLVAPLFVSAQSIYVPLHHWSYDFVERMETKGLISGVLNNTKPYSREEMAGYLLQMMQHENIGHLLTKVEQQQVDFLRFEYKEEFETLTGQDGMHYQSRLAKIKHSGLGTKVIPGFLYKNDRNLLNFQGDNFKIYIDPILYQTSLYANPDSIDRTDKVFEQSHGFTVWGRLGNHLGFFFDFRDTKEWGSRSYPSLFDISREGLGFVNGYGTHIWHDETVAYLMFKLPHVQVMIGKGSNIWGPGFHGALGLSDHATSYDQIKLQSTFWRLKFTYLWGFLRTFPVLRDTEGRVREKNIVGHRLDVNAARWLQLGLYETVVFSDRRFELAYANPINFYRSAEHALADNDNATMGFDFKFLLIPSVKIYGELFIDDLFTSKLGSGWFGNKTALLTGAFWADAFTVPNLDARVEYARARPFVYTHETDINAYSEFSTGLGHWMGPNADDLYGRLQYRFSKHFYIAAEFESLRHGANSPGNNIGGSITESHATRARNNIDFLAGEKERTNRFGVEISYELFRNLYFGFKMNTASGKNIALPAGGRGAVQRDEVGVSLSLNR